MIHPLFEGIFIGLTMAVMLGPALFALLQTSILRGTRAGVILASGIFLSDLVVVVCSYLGGAQLLNQSKKSIVIVPPTTPNTTTFFTSSDQPRDSSCLDLIAELHQDSYIQQQPNR